MSVVLLTTDSTTNYKFSFPINIMGNFPFRLKTLSLSQNYSFNYSFQTCVYKPHFTESKLSTFYTLYNDLRFKFIFGSGVNFTYAFNFNLNHKDLSSYYKKEIVKTITASTHKFFENILLTNTDISPNLFIKKEIFIQDFILKSFNKVFTVRDSEKREFSFFITTSINDLNKFIYSFSTMALNDNISVNEIFSISYKPFNEYKTTFRTASFTKNKKVIFEELNG